MQSSTEVAAGLLPEFKLAFAELTRQWDASNERLGYVESALEALVETGDDEGSRELTIHLFDQVAEARRLLLEAAGAQLAVARMLCG